MNQLTKKTPKSALIWVLCVIFTIAIAYYQRKTGPSYTISGKVNFAEETIKYKLIRTHGGDEDAKVRIPVQDTTIHAWCKFKRKNTNDDWTLQKMKHDGEYLVATLPHQPPAGKLIYYIILEKGSQSLTLTEDPVSIRFKGAVPSLVLILHIALIFMAMLFSTRTGIEAIFKGRNTYKYTFITLILFLLGGLVFGPIIQKYAFGAYWTGWPFGEDLTDNKALIAFIFWLVAFIVMTKNRNKRIWVIIASVVFILTYFIPHSILGSEYDYDTGQVKTERLD
jgi:hypothetical protein